MKKGIICPACKGSGLITRSKKKVTKEYILDNWDYSGYANGRKYHIIICKKCMGEGEI